ncbi:MAG: tripartite tricarboxylate transporter TctB family protein [Rhodoferax sp.]|nr:tripartite tricarboxylate transporter TctB family protein [Rhodoferax sp.]MCF8208100.1 tripartite tricarboxylate transporter TctB family protein [Rhodoferax sp.]
MQDIRSRRYQTAVSAGIVLLALGMGAVAFGISSDSGYAGVGPNFLPWVVALSLLVCGGFLFYEIRTGGFREMDEAPGEGAHPNWRGFAWMSAGMLISAALITQLGFILSCTLCFVLAGRGLRQAEGQVLNGWRPWVSDAIGGLLIAAPVYWIFGKFLAISLPGLTQSGWL